MIKITQLIPKSELDLVNKAIEFYLDQSMPTERESQRLTALQLLGLYEVSVSLTKPELEIFSEVHGIDFPDFETESKNQDNINFRAEILSESYGEDLVQQVLHEFYRVGYDRAIEAYELLGDYNKRECLLNLVNGIC